MLYKESQIKDIRTLFSQYKGKKMDSNAVIDLAFIANDMPEFNYNVKFKLNDTMHYPGYLDINNDGQLYIGMSGIREEALKLVRTNPNLCDNGIQAYNYWVTFFVLHELDHLHQYMEAYGITSYEDPRVAHVYRNIYDVLKQNDPEIEEKYDRMPLSFAQERTANIYTAENMYQIVGDSELEKLSRVNHLCYIVSGYRQNKHMKVISPVYATYRMLGIEDETSLSDLDFSTRFKNGLDISKEEYHSIFDDSKPLVDRDYHSIVKILK